MTKSTNLWCYVLNKRWQPLLKPGQYIYNWDPGPPCWKPNPAPVGTEEFVRELAKSRPIKDDEIFRFYTIERAPEHDQDLDDEDGTAFLVLTVESEPCGDEVSEEESERRYEEGRPSWQEIRARLEALRDRIWRETGGLVGKKLADPADAS